MVPGFRLEILEIVTVSVEDETFFGKVMRRFDTVFVSLNASRGLNFFLRSPKRRPSEQTAIFMTRVPVHTLCISILN